jgi:spore coat protein CotF
MKDLNQASSIYNDKQILQDSLMSQKHITDAYNTYAGECANPQLRSAMLTILNEEHGIQADIFSSMQSNGWYPTEQAEQQKIQQTKQKVTSAM